jgi:hypothetical protein
VDYSFDFPLSITLQDTFSVGDTIWYEIDLPNQLLDKNSGEEIDFTDYELYFDLSLGRSDTNFVYGASHLFDLYMEVGRVESQFGDIVLHFKSTNEKTFKLGVIPLRSGVHYSGVYLANDFFRIEDDNIGNGLEITNGMCREYMLAGSSCYTNNGYNNYHMLVDSCQYSPYDSLLVCVDDSIKFARGGYAFHVKN